MFEIVAGLVVLVVMSPAGRPFAALFVVGVVVTAYEAVMVAAAGATVGKLVLGLRVVELDHPSGVSWAAAWRRASVLGPLMTMGFPVPGLLASTGLSPLHRGVQDRVAGTYVVERRFAQAVDRAQLASIAEIELIPVPTRWGWAAPLPARRRGRLHRLDDAPLLVVATLALALLAAVGSDIRSVVLLTTVPWLVLFVVDETRRIARTGRTAGHRRAGLVVIDTKTGEPPGTGRSLLRALFLGFALYVPVIGWVLLLLPDVITLVVTEDHRALHDKVARTVVIVDPTLARDEQRLASMALDPTFAELAAPPAASDPAAVRTF